jgi:hypothetical protein
VLDGFVGSGRERTKGGGGPGSVRHAEGKGEEGGGGSSGVTRARAGGVGGPVATKARGRRMQAVSGGRWQGIERSR